VSASEGGRDGVLLADKPAGITSHDVVARTRSALGQRRIGHAGTLDPFATGLLIVLVGRATRLQRFFMDLPKTYEVLARLGATSTTGDPEGEIVETGVLPPSPLELPHGVIRQRPPAYSAVRIDGERAYVRARRGETVQPPERSVEIFEACELRREEDRVALRIVCSSGTYIRSVVGALGDAYCLELRRTAIGPFNVDGAWPTEGAPPQLLDLSGACERFLAVVELDADAARSLSHGRPVAIDAPDGPLLARDRDGAVAIAERRDGADGRSLLVPLVGLRAS
jgi:tRNA pseudouridine55 synthase